MTAAIDFWVGFGMGMASMATAAFVFYKNWRTEQELSALLAEELPEEKVAEIYAGSGEKTTIKEKKPE
jgi:hypothetical protein